VKTLSDSERKRIIGDYVAPKGYYDKTKAMPFLGKVTCHTDRLVAGSWHEIVLDYEVGASGLADGAWIKATFKFYSDWALFQTSDPRAANYVSAGYQPGPLLPGQEPATGIIRTYSVGPRALMKRMVMGAVAATQASSTSSQSTLH